MCVGKERDKHHQLRATCYLNDLDLNRWFVQHGHVLAYGTDSPQYLDAEKEAKKLKRGIWAGPFTPPVGMAPTQTRPLTTFMQCLPPLTLPVLGTAFDRDTYVILQ